MTCVRKRNGVSVIAGRGSVIGWKRRLCMMSSIFLIGSGSLSMAADSPADISSRYQKLWKNNDATKTTSENDAKSPIGLTSDVVPSEIKNALETRKLKWEDLGQVAQVGLLWAYGYLFLGIEDQELSKGSLTKVVPVYTNCQGKYGAPMTDVVMDKEKFTDNACTISQCGVIDKTSNEGCSTRLLKANIKCAFDLTKGDQFVDHGGSMWSYTSGPRNEIPYPQLYRHNITGTSSNSELEIYSIHFQRGSESAKECEKDGDLIIPCLGIPKETQSDFCRPPIDEEAVNTWLTTISNAVKSSDTREEDISSNTTLIVVIVLSVVLVLAGIGCWYFFYFRPRQMAKKMSTSNQMYNGGGDGQYGYGNGHMNNGGMAYLGPRKSSYDEGNYTLYAHGHGSGQNVILQDSSGEESTVMMNDSQLYSSSHSHMSSLASTMMKNTEDYCKESEFLAEFIEDPNVFTKRIPYDEITYLRLLSKGAFGEVWLGQLETHHVAIKRLLPEKAHTTRSIEGFCGEIRLMCTLEHPNIVQLLGVSWNRLQNICVITEYMESGDLDDVLRKNKEKLRWSKEKINISMDIAEGLVYLHSLRPIVIHRDLKSKNILLNKKYVAKLSDFGVSRKSSVNETMTSGVGTLLWTAPEIIEGKKYSEKADIYSLGVVLSEIDTCDLPFAAMKTDKGDRLPGMQLVQLVRLGKLKVSFADDCPQAVKDLAIACTQLDPDLRPSSMEVAYTLRSKILPQLRDGR